MYRNAIQSDVIIKHFARQTSDFDRGGYWVFNKRTTTYSRIDNLPYQASYSMLARMIIVSQSSWEMIFPSMVPGNRNCVYFIVLSI